METVINIVYAVVMALAAVYASLKFLHMLQLESYQGKMYLKWLWRAGKADWLLLVFFGLISLVLRVGYVLFAVSIPTLANILWYAADIVYVLLLVLYGVTTQKRPAKKKLQFTGRMIRMMVLLAIICVLFHFAFFARFDISTWGGFLLMNIIRYLPMFLLPLFVLLAYGIMLPVENGIKRYYFRDAQKKLAARKDVIRIGITGSFGKTSTKFALGTMLSKAYPVLVTPASYNTPMGVTRVIREQLTDEHRAFVAEMGARYTGDIAMLCDLVHPQYGIITAVGKQHMETFRTYENLISTKAELLRAIPEDGAAFINGDNEDCRGMFDACMLKNKFLFGIDGEGLYMRAADIRANAQGSRFTLQTQDGESVECTTVLLGKHNILNITGAAALAHYLGVSMQQIAEAIAELTPTEHRLQLIPGEVTVIDDAFNANPAGTKAALEVLSMFPGKKIVVTPGMVELGEEEDALNEAFGRDMAAVADVVFLVGKSHVEPIRKGMLEAGFNPDCIVQADDLNQVTEKLPQYTQAGCVVLFENDLPDNYNE